MIETYKTWLIALAHFLVTLIQLFPVVIVTATAITVLAVALSVIQHR